MKNDINLINKPLVTNLLSYFFYLSLNCFYQSLRVFAKILRCFSLKWLLSDFTIKAKLNAMM